MALFRMGFRTRLAAVFVLLAVVPMALLTFFYLRYLTNTIEYWQSPGIERTLENSLAVARESLEHYRQEAQAAGEFVLVLLDPALDGEGTSTFLRTNAPEVGLDLLAVYRLGENGWRRWATGGTETAPDVLDPAIARAALAGSTAPPLDLSSPSVCAVLPMGADEQDGLLLSGVRPPAKVMETIRSLVADADLYRRLAGYERIQTMTVVVGTIIVFALVIAVSLVVARMLAKSISSPILELVEGTRRLSSGDLDHPVETRAKDEIGLLVTSFNQMTSDLRVSKNPLTPVQLSIHRLRKRIPGRDPETQQVFTECLDLMDTEVANLRRLADEFSQFARMPRPSPRPSDLGELAQSVADLYRESAHGIDIRLDIPPDLPSVPVDRGQFRQAVGNLIKNALEAMPSGGTLSVDLKASAPAQPGVWISITDTGGGLPGEIQDRIFDPYVTTKKQGSGLGLAIVHRIVTDHGGSVDVRSEEGSGATFRLFFPMTES